MDTLLIRLAAPMQAWGVQSHGENRDTALEPSKSGVIGLLCAALGRDRADALDDLCALRMGVRVDREGRLQSDYQTIHHILPNGQEVDKNSMFYALLSGRSRIPGWTGRQP
jgi:CRISPR system Cascade subunit CasD